MTEMTIGFTPTFTWTLPARIDLTQAQNVYFTITQGAVSVTKTGEDVEVIDAHTAEVSLTQEDTLKFRKGEGEMQLNWTYPNSARTGTAKDGVIIYDNLLKRVLD